MKRRLGLTQLRLTSLRTRLFLAIFATCILLVIIMHFGVRSSFQSGFIGYIKTDNQQRTKLIADALAEQYQEVGSWQFLMKDERAFSVYYVLSNKDSMPAMTSKTADNMAQ